MAPGYAVQMYRDCATVQYSSIHGQAKITEEPEINMWHCDRKWNHLCIVDVLCVANKKIRKVLKDEMNWGNWMEL